ncbi:unnamed protein product [Polarella glacialis]|uniref:Dolichyldiphosphatase n=1 Tax=Polarella glacialis TaxID=89957 RepID=A0A813FSQ9_POLGL|nr:unnamed protein product [Polarella glacialis]
MDGSPMLEPDPSGKLVGRFWLDQAAAVERLAKFKEAAAEAGDVKSMEVRQIPLSEVYLQLIVGGNEAQLGGQLRIEPLPREVRNAQQILAGAYLGPSGTVPLFFCSTLVLESRGISFVPAFLREKDLLETLKKAGGTGARTEITTLQNVAEKLGEQAKSGTDVGWRHIGLPTPGVFCLRVGATVECSRPEAALGQAAAASPGCGVSCSPHLHLPGTASLSLGWLTKIQVDPGMPSSHAPQSLGFLSSYAALELARSADSSLSWAVLAPSATLASGAFLSWLRLALGFHTLAQVSVGHLLGMCTAAAWRWLYAKLLMPALAADPGGPAQVCLHAATGAAVFLFSIKALTNWRPCIASSSKLNSLLFSYFVCVMFL